MKLKHIAVLTLIPLLTPGCWWRHKQQAVRTTPLENFAPRVDKKSGGDLKLIVTPETALIGKIAAVNANAKFAVLNFPVGHLPSMEQRLNVYRNGLKVGEVKITGPQRDDNTVADIVAGESKIGDEVREN